MRALTIIVAVLVVTLVLGGPMKSYADPQLDTLVNIATQARNNLNISISQISNVSGDIAGLYKQGSDETDALVKAASAQDSASAKQHFLAAMNFFKQTNDKINSLNATEASDQQRTEITKMQSEIARLGKIAGTLRTIAITNNVDFDFAPFDTSIQQAKQALDAGRMDDAAKSIDAANQLIINAHQSLSDAAQKMTSNRAKDFTEKQMERFSKISVPNATQNSVAPVSNVTSSSSASNSTEPQSPAEMIAKLRQLVAQGNVDEALKIIKSLDAYQKKSERNESVVQTQAAAQNNTALSPAANATSQVPNEQDNSTGSGSSGQNATGSPPSNVHQNLAPGNLNNSSPNVPPNQPNVPNNARPVQSNGTGEHEDKDRHKMILQTGPQNGTNPVPVHTFNSSSIAQTNSSGVIPVNSSKSISEQSDKGKKEKPVFQIIPQQGNSTQQQDKGHDKKEQKQEKEKSKHARQSRD